MPEIDLVLADSYKLGEIFMIPLKVESLVGISLLLINLHDRVENSKYQKIKGKARKRERGERKKE
jgi:hypothetical protein